ncbi:MAG TPA: SurA N-terminal domain-containing protein [Pseudolabrys sp.]|nr:SurA N-terminal domain-containing protein [Pseudolabrys sp.]
MLRGIHKATSTWVGKAVMAVVMGGLIISFAIWGIGDIFRGFGLNSALKIGNTEISTEQFRQYYTDHLQQLSRQVGRPITPDQARATGIDRQVLSQLVAETTLDQQAKALRLGISNDEIANRITNDPSFRGLNGQFDHSRFVEIIRQAGFTEGRFVEEQRRVILRRQIAYSVGGEFNVPVTAMTALNQYQNEKRTIEYLALGPAQAGDIPAPTPELLSKFFEERKVLFRAPEYRKITLLSMSPADLAKPDAVFDAEAKTYYEQHKASYGTPERRELHQIVFPNPEEAAAAHERIAKGASLADLAKERGLKDSDTDVGMVTKADVIDPAVADAAFALKAGEVSTPVKGRFGTVLLQIGKIEPGNQKTYEEVAPQVKREIAENRAKTEIGNLRDKFDDERAAGSTLAETAKKLGLTSLTIDAVDRSGRGPDGKPIADLPTTPDAIAAGFGSDVGVDNDPLQLPNGGYLWYDVTGITPARERTLDEVKDQVEARWRDDEIAKRLQAKTDDMVGKLKAGTTLAQLATESGLKVVTATELQRGKRGGFAPAKLVDAAFKSPKGVPASTAGDQVTAHFVFQVTDIVDPTLDPIASKTITTSLQNSYTDDIVGAYVTRLESDFGVTLNQQALTQVFGGAPANTGNTGDY